MSGAKSGLLDTLKSLRGNQRACVLTEPMWGIPFWMYAPFATLYMTALGLTKADIGLLTSLGLVVQMVSAFMSGILTDKLGRRRCTVIFDILAWSVATLVWAFAQNFTWFIVAALFNGIWRVTVTSWGLLLTEDNDEKKMLHIWTLVTLMGTTSIFFMPLASVLVRTLELVPAVRIIYGFACLVMTAKFVVLFIFSNETSVGKRRMAATKGVSIARMIRESWPVLLEMLRSKRLLLAIAVLTAYQVVRSNTEAFWALLLTQKLGIQESNVIFFSMGRTLISIICLFVIVPRVSTERFKRPLLTAWVVLIANALLLISIPRGGAVVPLLILSTILEALSMSMLGPMTESLIYIHSDVEERARNIGMIYALVMLATAVFPAICGRMAEISLNWPFIICVGVMGVGIVLTILAAREVAAQKSELPG